LLALVGVFFSRTGGKELGYVFLAPFALLGLMLSWMGAAFLGALILSKFGVGENWERERQDLFMTVCPVVGLATLLLIAAIAWSFTGEQWW
jgi:hypothetical protein